MLLLNWHRDTTKNKINAAKNCFAHNFKIRKFLKGTTRNSTDRIWASYKLNCFFFACCNLKIVTLPLYTCKKCQVLPSKLCLIKERKNKEKGGHGECHATPRKGSFAGMRWPHLVANLTAHHVIIMFAVVRQNMNWNCYCGVQYTVVSQAGINSSRSFSRTITLDC